MPAKSVRVGVVQQAIPNNDTSHNWKQSAAAIEQLANAGCNCILLQELHGTRYFCQQQSDDNFSLADTIPGNATQFFGQLSAQLDIVLVISLFEQRAPGLYHNTAVVFDKSPAVAGIYRKMHIPDDPGFNEKYYFTPGDQGFEPIQTSIGKLGVLVCWDQWFPEAARLMALAGADLLLYPTAIGWDPHDSSDEQKRQLDAWITIQRSHAIANAIPVVVANRTGYEPSPSDTKTGIQFWGSSFIAGPQGEILAQAATDQPETIQAVLDLSRTVKLRQIWPWFRDRRIDAYGNIVKRWNT